MLSNNMVDLLPAIDIAVPIELSIFFERIAEIGNSSGNFKVEHFKGKEAGPDLEVVNFRSEKDSQHSGLGFQLIARKDIPQRVLLEVRARRWNPNPPTRAAYIDAARLLAGPLLKTYNQTNSARIRLRIEQAGQGRFSPSKRTAALLEHFTALANTSSLHPLDWKRFYTLIKESRQKIPENELRSILVRRGFPSETAEYLANIYKHLWKFRRFK
ncbi:hypothetical protein [Sphingorhabdus sp. YGSMI21]|uniref:hypothetical protein n=1 Tax=Sphingorhabdus sp. YGSMI21 TaxID=2077182 RepID=UPI000C1E7A0D|nr:hypothetical protein [Sphingorhabdus sp. YGSMI21]ATW02112.1 hypothetical protein CHN51_00100 [Sphingorhabdus sp. YGSMI21]